MGEPRQAEAFECRIVGASPVIRDTEAAYLVDVQANPSGSIH
jgi:hypothetical protein